MEGGRVGGGRGEGGRVEGGPGVELGLPSCCQRQCLLSMLCAISLDTMLAENNVNFRPTP